MGWMKKSLLTAAAAATALAAAGPASAEHYYGPPGHGYGRQGRFGQDVYVSNHYYYGSHDYRHRHHRGGLSGGEAALLAAGIIGGMILIDRATETDRYGDRYDHRYSDRYDRSEPDPRDGRHRTDDRRYGELEGGRASPSEYNYGAAYNDCKAETREAARESGVVVSLPAKPQRIIPINEGGAVRFEASYRASDSRGEWNRSMICEADADGVRHLELV